MKAIIYAVIKLYATINTYNKGKCVMLKQNSKLESLGFTIRCVTFSQKYVELSNGVILDSKNAVERFFRRLNSGWNVDLAYHTLQGIRDKYVKEYKTNLARKGGINCQQQNPHIREIAKENCRKAVASGANSKKMREGKITIWNKGLTKDTDPRVKDISDRQTGLTNTCHRQTQETRNRVSANNSKIMKAKILSGEFTPNIRNSNTHWQCQYNNHKFRSSWEAAWFVLNQSYEYETKRIKYFYEGKEKIYIIDFFDPATNTIVEIKPKEHLRNNKMLAKIEAANKWAADNNGEYKIITQDYLLEHMDRIQASDLPYEVKLKIKGIK